MSSARNSEICERSSQNHLLLDSKYFVFFDLDFYPCYFTFDSNLSRSLRILFLISSDWPLGNGVARIMFSLKNFLKQYLHSPLLYLRQDLECECTSHVVTNWKNLRYVTLFGTNNFVVKSTNLTYSSTLFLCKTGACDI